MAQLVDIQRLEVGPEKLAATVRIADSGPLMTSDDLEGTTRVYNLMPHIIEHLCLGDAGEVFRDVMGNTELAHLLEHMTVELLAQSGIAGDIASGRTRRVGPDDRTFEIELACPDDVLVAGALSSACWMMSWAFGGGGDPEPDVDATVRGLVSLVQSLPEPAAQPAAEPGVAPEATATGQVPLRLVADEEGPVTVPAPTADPSSSTAVGSTSDNSEPERLPQASPEARQAAADSPADSANSSGASLSGRQARTDRAIPHAGGMYGTTPIR